MKKAKIIAVSASTLILAFGPSCSTTKGFGQDLQKVGSRIENKAESTGGTAPPPSTGLTSPNPTPGVPSAY